MKPFKTSLVFLLLSLLISACAETTPAAPVTPTPLANIPITNDAGETISYQPNSPWVLISGVDEHGLLAEPQLSLHTTPAPGATITTTLETGLPAKTLEIRHLGPQGIQRFYFVELANGATGWISDYYIVNTVYLFNINSTTVPVYSEKGSGIVQEIPNVSPATIIDPITSLGWWLVQLPEQENPVWVIASMVKESPEEEFLLPGLHEDHDH